MFFQVSQFKLQYFIILKKKLAKQTALNIADSDEVQFNWT